MLACCLLFVAATFAQSAPVVPTQPFTPTPIRLTLDDLPAPYATSSATKPAIVVDVPSNATLLVADVNFRVTIYRSGLRTPRQMIYTPTDDILVTENRGGSISILTGDTTSVFADASNGISQAFGMAFVPGWFYVANAGDLRRFRYQTGDRRIMGTGQVLLTYPSTYHWTRSLILSPSGDRLFVTVGSGSNVDIEYPSRASVQIANLDGTANATFAWGLRNPVGIDFHPKTGELYVAVQERDELGDDLVPDYFTRIQKDEFYGWPFAYLTPKNVDPRRRFANGSSERPDLVEITRTPDVLLQAHSAVLDMQFYRGTQFPSRYQNGAFIACHGSWNRNAGTGYKLIFIPFNDSNRPQGYYEEFLKGFLLDPQGPTTYGRPVGLLEMKDGSLLFSEDGNGRIYRIEYVKSTVSSK
ncbi:unnamed protein product [Rotaria socialis]|uniref:Pyrroloquinoline quinone-dependent pyranose dehydrogenase beta-propeller domain-containing protein n=1 Tax=Rotaria socialis TaxID=392032 RepID=A0A821XGX5_9BILA|nr:unnamed protein product [Rotaria socialis]CAF3407868.1 unnamed protein product [Rotaria socialis]CAF4205243.1 unnamed protein product [Rotaria socialis]CAF4938366.1 unnamed protein product [Rotaria socialis]